MYNMLISLQELVNKYKINFKGILHVGAHECEELNGYENYISREKILWVEAMKDKVDLCKEKYPGINIEQAVISDKIETVRFNISNNGQSSSVLEFGTHSQEHPWVVYVDKIEQKSITIDSFFRRNNINKVVKNISIFYNFKYSISRIFCMKQRPRI